MFKFFKSVFESVIQEQGRSLLELMIAITFVVVIIFSLNFQPIFNMFGTISSGNQMIQSIQETAHQLEALFEDSSAIQILSDTQIELVKDGQVIQIYSDPVSENSSSLFMTIDNGEAILLQKGLLFNPVNSIEGVRFEFLNNSSQLFEGAQTNQTIKVSLFFEDSQGVIQSYFKLFVMRQSYETIYSSY